MSDEELDRLADKVAAKLQTNLIDGIYRDAGRSLVGTFKHVLWALVIAMAAWGAAKYGVER